MTSSSRVVFDSNVLISAALSLSGVPRQALVAVAREGVLLMSRGTFSELVTRLRRPKFARYLDENDREEYIAWVAARAEFVEPLERITACRDPDDDKFLELAISGRADLIITGDGDLLLLDPFRGIAIVTPAEFVRALSSSQTE